MRKCASLRSHPSSPRSCLAYICCILQLSEILHAIYLNHLRMYCIPSSVLLRLSAQATCSQASPSWVRRIALWQVVDIGNLLPVCQLRVAPGHLLPSRRLRTQLRVTLPTTATSCHRSRCQAATIIKKWQTRPDGPRPTRTGAASCLVSSFPHNPIQSCALKPKYNRGPNCYPSSGAANQHDELDYESLFPVPAGELRNTRMSGSSSRRTGSKKATMRISFPGSALGGGRAECHFQPVSVGRKAGATDPTGPTNQTTHPLHLSPGENLASGPCWPWLAWASLTNGDLGNISCGEAVPP